MYNCGKSIIDLLWANYRQVVKISFCGTEESLVIQEDSVLQGGLSIDRYSVSGSKIEIGSAVAAELSLNLKNNDGRFDNVVFEGAELFVQIGVQKWDAHRWEKAITHWIPCGYFIVDEPPRALSTISLSALDRMVKFDRLVDANLLKFPMTVEDLVNKCCDICNVTNATNLKALPNHDYSISEFPGEEQDLTYRTLIQWCAALLGTCAYINYDGQIEFRWYEQTDITVTPSERYSSDMLENDITLSGIVFADADSNQYIAGDDTYALDISSNGLVQAYPQNVVDALYVVLKDFVYRPYEATIRTAPFLYPMDMVHYIDAKGVQHDTIITNITFTMNGGTTIAGKGETTQQSSYSASGGLTKQQTKILEHMKNTIDKYVDAKEQAVIELNQVIANSMGLHCIEDGKEDGSVIYYFCNAETLKDSNIIYTFRAGGFCWTDTWNGEETIWNYGFTKNGNSVLHALLTYKITTEYLDAGCVTAEKISSEYTSSIEQYTDTALESYSTTEQMHTAISQSEEDIQMVVGSSIQSTVETSEGNMKEYVDNQNETLSLTITEQYQTAIDQTKSDVTIDISSLEGRVTTTENGLEEYRNETHTYFQFADDGLNIGKKENDDTSPYAININNEKMGFLQNDMEVAYIQYNKMHINAVEAVDRLSVGAAADGGYFDFISTPQGMGIKWRAVNEAEPTTVLKLNALKAAVYVPIVDDDEIFRIEGDEA